MTRPEALEGVKDCIALALGIDREGISEEQRLIGDLGAASLDLLDLTFHLEKQFAISIKPRDIERRAVAELQGRPAAIDGAYTEEALALLRRAMPEVPAEELAPGLLAAELPRRFRVATMVSLVMRLKSEQAEHKADEGGAQ